MSLLEIKNLTMRFGGLVAVDGVSINIEPNEIISIIGPNGAGKTTVFNAVTGIYEPTSGQIILNAHETHQEFTAQTAVRFAIVGLLTAAALTVLVNAESLWQLAITANYEYLQPFHWSKAVSSALAFFKESPLQRLVIPALIGLVVGIAGSISVWQRSRRAPEVAAGLGIARTFQNIRLFNHMTVLDNILIGMDSQLRTGFWDSALRLPSFRREREEAVQQAFKMLQFVGLEKQIDELAENLAYGHQRRLEIARALAMKPTLLLLDEPAAGLNPAESKALMELIHNIRDRGTTVALIEHDMQVVMAISHHIAVLDHGKKIAEGTPNEIRCNPKVIEAYLGKAHEDAPSA